MEKALFSVSCTTCRARLAVRNKEAIGEILECPKCGSMVLISPPEGWVSGRTATPPRPPAKDPGWPRNRQPLRKNGDSAIGRGGLPVARETASEKPAVEPPPVQLPASASAEVVCAPHFRRKLRPLLSCEIATASRRPPTADGLRHACCDCGRAGGLYALRTAGSVAGETFLSSLTRSLWGRVAVLVVSGLLGLAGVLAAWTVVSNRHTLPIRSPTTRRPTPRLPTPPPADADAKPALPPAQFNRRWLPEQTLLLIDLRLSRLSTTAAGDELAGLSWSLVATSSQALLIGLHLGQEQVRRLTWASTDLADCAAQLRGRPRIGRRHRRGQAVAAGENIDLGANLVARRPPGGPWPHPLLAVDAHTIVTGSEEALRQLVARGGDAELASATDGTVAQEALAGRRPGRDGRSFAGADCGVEVAGQPAGCLAGRQVEVALALRDSAGLGTFGPVGRPAAMRTGAGLQR